MCGHPNPTTHYHRDSDPKCDYYQENIRFISSHLSSVWIDCDYGTDCRRLDSVHSYGLCDSEEEERKGG